MCISSQKGISGLFTKPGLWTWVVLEQWAKRWGDKPQGSQCKWVTALQNLSGESSVPLPLSHGLSKPALIVLDLGLHSAGREKTQLQTAIWNKSCLLLTPVPHTPPPNLMGLNHREARLLPYFIFSNVNERPSRDILFLIKLEEPYSCLWVNTALWDTQEPSSGSALGRLRTAPPAARGITSFLLTYIYMWFFFFPLNEPPLGMLERKGSCLNW